MYAINNIIPRCMYDIYFHSGILQHWKAVLISHFTYPTTLSLKLAAFFQAQSQIVTISALILPTKTFCFSDYLSEAITNPFFDTDQVNSWEPVYRRLLHLPLPIKFAFFSCAVFQRCTNKVSLFSTCRKRKEFGNSNNTTCARCTASKIHPRAIPICSLLTCTVPEKCFGTVFDLWS